MSYRQMRNYENLEKRIYDGVGAFDIPRLEPAQFNEKCEFISFSQALQCTDRENKGIHFFLDDYRFNRLWMRPDRYINMLSQFKCVMTPDFSLYTDFPKALQIYNHYRKHWLGAYMQENGITVIPTICWGTEDSFEWCFDGEPEGGMVAVSSLGTQNSIKRKELFLSGYAAMIKRLQPETILFYGNIPEGCEGNVIQIKPFQERFKEGKHNGW